MCESVSEGQAPCLVYQVRTLTAQGAFSGAQSVAETELWMLTQQWGVRLSGEHTQSFAHLQVFTGAQERSFSPD